MPKPVYFIVKNNDIFGINYVKLAESEWLFYYKYF